MSGNLPGETIEMSTSPTTFARVGSMRSEDTQFSLLNAYENNNLELFEKILQNECDVNHLYEKDYKTLLDTAAEDSDRVEFARLLIKHGADVNLTNAVRGKAPIHFAASAGNLPMLKLLIESGADVNLLDKRSFTILHCVCEQKWQQYGDDRYRKCLEYLLSLDGLDLNVLNKKGQTAIHLSAIQGSEEPVRMLLEKGSFLDIDSNKIGPGKKSARDVIMDKFPHLTVDLPVVQPIQMIKMDTSRLFNLLARRLEDRFCDAFVKEMEDKAQKSLLTANNGVMTFLQYACSEGLASAAKTLLESGADVNFVSVDDSTPIQLVCNKGDILTLQVLLEHNPDCSPNKMGETVLHILAKESQTRKFSECLSLLLNSTTAQNLDVNVQDFKGNTPLHYAVKYGDQKSVLELLKHGAYIGTKNVFNETPLSSMTYSTLEQHLNSCLSTNNVLSREENYGLIFDYKCLKSPKYTSVRNTIRTNKNEVEIPLTEDSMIDYKKSKKIYLMETDPLVYISKIKDLRHLLTHPIFASFIYLKWQRIRLLYYINSSFYFLFCFFLTIFVLSGHRDVHDDPVSLNEIVTESEKVLHNKINESKLTKPTSSVVDDNNLVWLDFVRFILIFLTSVLIVRELFQFLVNPKKYLTDFENWLEILIISVTICIIGFGCNKADDDTRQCSQLFSIVILASWIEIVLLIGKHPLLCVNIEMFKTVSVNFIKFLSWYIILIIAFALSFFTLFRYCTSEDCSENWFLNPFSSLFKTLIMLTGEFESGEIPFVSYRGTSHLIFVLFIFVIVMVLVNLLTGLAVSDTQAIRDDAVLYSYISRVKLIAYFETMVLGDPLFSRRLNKQIRGLFGCSSDQLGLPDEQPVLCIEYFAKRIVFFSGLLPDSSVYVYPNLNNSIAFKADDLPCSEQSCLQRFSKYQLDSSTISTAEKIIAEYKATSVNDNSDFENLKAQLENCLTSLSSVQKRLEVVEHGNKQNEQLLIQILAIISLNSNK